jgi:hypothetical protein
MRCGPHVLTVYRQSQSGSLYGSRNSSTSEPELGSKSEVLASSPTSAELRQATLAERARLLIRCADLDGETYCLHVGFTEQDVTSPKFWAEKIAAIESAPASQTGAMTALPALLRPVARPTPQSGRRHSHTH